ncbi:MAG: ferredoxin reductase [Pseudomonadota bacterium]
MNASQTKQNLLQRAYRQFSMALVNSGSLTHYFEPLFEPYSPLGGFAHQRAEVVGLRWESDQVYTVVLRPNKMWGGFEAGQFIELGVEYNGARMTRCFSISSSPDQWRREGTIELSIRVQSEGKITPWLPRALQLGQSVGLSKAQGEFTRVASASRHLMVAGGSGITPFRSMLQEAASRGDESDITLLYYASSAGQHLFEEEFRQAAERCPNLRLVFVASDSDGRLNAAQLEQHCPDFARREIYLCGPNGLIQGARDLFSDLGVADSQVHYEHFGPAPIDYDSAATGGRVVLRVSGAEVDADGTRSLLDEAESTGARPQAGCRIGVCHQCKCRKASGVVLNTRTGTLSDSGPEDIQLCISVPVGEVEIEA